MDKVPNAKDGDFVSSMLDLQRDEYGISNPAQVAVEVMNTQATNASPPREWPKGNIIDDVENDLLDGRLQLPQPIVSFRGEDERVTHFGLEFPI